MKVAVVMLALALAGCEADAVKTERRGMNVQVDTLFTKDGVTVYRFLDGRWHYYAVKGDKLSTMSTYSCGKNCYSDEEIETVTR